MEQGQWPSRKEYKAGFQHSVFLYVKINASLS
jgi:hypothetical protein